MMITRSRRLRKIWRDVRNMLDKEYPEAALVSEWSNPEQAINGGGFHMDFYLDHWHNGYNTLLRDHETGGEDNSFFLKSGKGDICRFLNDICLNTRQQSRMVISLCLHATMIHPRPCQYINARRVKDCICIYLNNARSTIYLLW